MEAEKKKEDEQITETKRVSRNINEKKRRDRFNILLHELAVVISPSNRYRKYEKSTVLKEAIACLKTHQDTSEGKNTVSAQSKKIWPTSLIGGAELSQIIIEAMNDFVLSLDCSGIITFASQSILSALGYRCEEMIYNSIADFLDQSDQSSIFSHLSLLQREGNSLPSHAFHFTGKSKAVSKPFVFQMNLVHGPHIDKEGFVTTNCFGQPYIMSRNTNREHVTTQSNRIAQNTKLQLVIVGTLRYPKSNIIAALSNTKDKEFTSRLTLGWNYTFVDNRVLLIMGYLPSELINKSAYLFFKNEDIANVSMYHEILRFKGRVTTCYYRFLTKGETWVWLQSCCYVSYNQWNSKPEYITSTNTVVNYEEVCANQDKLLKQDKLKFKNIYKRKMVSSRSASPKVVPQTSSKVQELPQVQTSIKPQYFTQSSTTEYNKPNADYNLPVSETPLLKSDNNLRRESQSLVSDPMDVESISSETSDLTPSISGMKVPEGLTPAQCKLHVQLQGKHRVLENSIQHQIKELERIKNQIEINKQLWDFNKQLQKKKNEEKEQGIKRVLPAKRGLQSDSFLNGVNSSNAAKLSPLHLNSEPPYTVPYQVETPSISRYLDIPPAKRGLQSDSFLSGVNSSSTAKLSPLHLNSEPPPYTVPFQVETPSISRYLDIPPPKRGLQSDSFLSGVNSSSTAKLSPLHLNSESPYTVPFQVEAPRASQYLDIPPITFGDSSILYGMDEINHNDSHTRFSDTIPPSSLLTQPYSYYLHN